MTIAQLIKELMDSAKERAKTPIAGSFVLAFLLYNWRPLFLLMFSDASIEDRIALIDKDYCNIWAVVIPFISAALYVGLVQYIMLLFDYATTYAYNNRKLNRHSRQKHDLESFREVLKEQQKNEDIRSGNLAKSQLNDEIERLKNELEAAIKTKQDIQEESYKAISTITDNFEKLKYKNALLSKKLTQKNLDTDYIDDAKINESMNALNQYEKRQFLNFVDHYGQNNRVATNTLSSSQVISYLDLKLIDNYTDNSLIITALGMAVYNKIVITIDY